MPPQNKQNDLTSHEMEQEKEGRKRWRREKEDE